MHLRQPGFTYSGWGQFTKNKERIQKFEKMRIQDILIKTNQTQPAFSKVWLMDVSIILPRRTTSNKALRDKPLNIAKKLKPDEYQHKIASMVYVFFH